MIQPPITSGYIISLFSKPLDGLGVRNLRDKFKHAPDRFTRAGELLQPILLTDGFPRQLYVLATAMRLHGLVDRTDDDFVVERFVRKSNAPAFRP